MSRFTSHLGLSLLEDAGGRAITKGGRCQWLVCSPLRYDVGAEGSGETVTVPAGVTTDLASIPRLAWSLFPPDGPWLKAAVVHDFLYSTRGVCPGARHIGGTRFLAPYSRREADGILHEAMGVLGVSHFQRDVIWAAGADGAARAARGRQT